MHAQTMKFMRNIFFFNFFFKKVLYVRNELKEYIYRVFLILT